MSMAGEVPGEVWVRQNGAHFVHKRPSSFQPLESTLTSALAELLQPSILILYSATSLAILSIMLSRLKGRALLTAF